MLMETLPHWGDICTLWFSKIVSMIRKYHNQKLQTNPWHREEEPHNNHETRKRQTKQSNQLSLFPIKMIAKLEGIQSNVQQNIEQLQTPTMGVTSQQHRTTTLELKQPKPPGGGGGGLNAFYWYQIFALDSAVVEVKLHQLYIRI